MSWEQSAAAQVHQPRLHHPTSREPWKRSPETRRGPGPIPESQCCPCYPAPVPQVYRSLGFTCILGHPCQQVRGGQYPSPGPARNRSYRKRRRGFGTWCVCGELGAWAQRASLGWESLFLCPGTGRLPGCVGPRPLQRPPDCRPGLPAAEGNPDTPARTVTLSGHRALSGVSCPPQQVLADHPRWVSAQENPTRPCRLSESSPPPPKLLTQTA